MPSVTRLRNHPSPTPDISARSDSPSPHLPGAASPRHRLLPSLSHSLSQTRRFFGWMTRDTPSVLLMLPDGGIRLYPNRVTAGALRREFPDCAIRCAMTKETVVDADVPLTAGRTYTLEPLRTRAINYQPACPPHSSAESYYDSASSKSYIPSSMPLLTPRDAAGSHPSFPSSSSLSESSSSSAARSSIGASSSSSRSFSHSSFESEAPILPSSPKRRSFSPAPHQAMLPGSARFRQSSPLLHSERTPPARARSQKSRSATFFLGTETQATTTNSGASQKTKSFCVQERMRQGTELSRLHRVEGVDLFSPGSLSNGTSSPSTGSERAQARASGLSEEKKNQYVQEQLRVSMHHRQSHAQSRQIQPASCQIQGLPHQPQPRMQLNQAQQRRERPVQENVFGQEEALEHQQQQQQQQQQRVHQREQQSHHYHARLQSQGTMRRTEGYAVTTCAQTLAFCGGHASKT